MEARDAADAGDEVDACGTVVDTGDGGRGDTVADAGDTGRGNTAGDNGDTGRGGTVGTGSTPLPPHG